MRFQSNPLTKGIHIKKVPRNICNTQHGAKIPASYTHATFHSQFLHFFLPHWQKQFLVQTLQHATSNKKIKMTCFV